MEIGSCLLQVKWFRIHPIILNNRTPQNDHNPGRKRIEKQWTLKIKTQK